MGNLIAGINYCAFAVTFREWGTWPNVVGLELLAVAVFGLLEMARPVNDFFLHRAFLSFPIIAGSRRHGWDFVYLGWPMLTVAVWYLLLMWRVFFLHVAGPARARSGARSR